MIEKFQFQCGAIKSVNNGVAADAFVVFQFQCGAIKSQLQFITAIIN